MRKNRIIKERSISIADWSKLVRGKCEINEECSKLRLRHGETYRKLR